MPRIVVPEILDELPADDPAAIRSRRDLAMINWLMGNQRWISTQVARHPAAAGITEIGAGDGALTTRLARQHPSSRVVGVDLVARPNGLPAAVHWLQGDVFHLLDGPLDAALGSVRGGLLVANLFLHHFEDPALARLGQLLGRFDALVVCEPRRGRSARLLGLPLQPFIHPVTRHDMRVSIAAGFRPGELPRLLGLDASWTISETCGWRGSQRMVAWRA